MQAKAASFFRSYADGCPRYLRFVHLCSQIKMRSILQSTFTVFPFRSHLQVYLVCARQPRNAMASGFPHALVLYLWCTIPAALLAAYSALAFDAKRS